MILVTHTTTQTLARDTFVFATSAKLEDGILVLRDPLKRAIASFDPLNVVAVHRRDGPNGPQMAMPIAKSGPVARPRDFGGGDTTPAVFDASARGAA